jgi:N-acyl-D-amino-acid deacylase
MLSLALLLAFAASTPDAAPAEAVDLVIRNGRLLDGTGAAPRSADIVVDRGRIVYVGRLDDTAPVVARRSIDAGGRIVAPGFIDPHSHGDPLATPAFENFLAMGVTTITLGQDGASPAVTDLAAWLRRVATNGIGPNLAMFVGHGTLRTQSGIGTSRDPSSEQLRAMQARLDAALEHTFGLSTGLEYNPGLHAGPEELKALAKVVGVRGRVVMSHLRSEDDPRLEASLEELIAQGRHARVHVAHLKSVYGQGAGRAEEILSYIARARSRGVTITADIYPYTASYTGITLLFPEWAKTREGFEVARQSRYEELAEYLYRRVMSRNGPQATLLGTAPWTGRTLAEVASKLEKPFAQVLIDDIGPGGASAAYFVMDDALQARLLVDEHVAICSDGSPTGFHPRGHGTFARVIEHFVMERELLPLAEAVRKMTSLPASILGLTDRGVIAPGMAADVLVFDPRQVRERARYPNPKVLAEGFDIVVVNGRVAREDGVLTGVLAGTVLSPETTGR